MPSLSSKKIIFAIHDAHPWGGQDKYTLEIARWIAVKRSVEIHAFTLQGTGRFVFKKVSPRLRSPVLLKSIYFHILLWFRFARLNSNDVFINGMGACSLKSDVVQVLFLHKAWQVRQKKNPENKTKLNLKQRLHQFYHLVLQKYDLWTERLVFKAEKKYIAISNTVANEVLRFYPEIKHVSVVYPGIDPTDFAPVSDDPMVRNLSIRASLKIKEDELIFLFVGSFERKGLALVLESLSKASANKWSLIVIGKGNVPEYQKIAHEFGIEEKVIFLGTQKNVAQFYQTADFFIFPTQYEPFGMVVLEAMACGCVPIVSACAGAAELVNDQKNGILIHDETSVPEISSIINKILLDPKPFKQMAVEARSTAKHYTWEQVANRYLAEIEE